MHRSFYVTSIKCYENWSFLPGKVAFEVTFDMRLRFRPNREEHDNLIDGNSKHGCIVSVLHRFYTSL